MKGNVRVVLTVVFTHSPATDSDVVGDFRPSISKRQLQELRSSILQQDVKILPVVLTGGVPPAILDDLQYADLTKNRPEALKSLLKAIR